MDRAALRAATRYEDGRLYWVSHPRYKTMNGQPVGGDHLGKNGYRQARFQGRVHSQHRLIWAWHHDSDPPQINHINEDKLDNRIENLEASNPRHNTRHSSKNTLPVNIQRHGNGYRGRLSVGGRGGRRLYTKVVPTVEQAQQSLTQLEATWQLS